ncbi:hypothetical protein BASA50_001003 [Batrachochytrium salamandrivorans]|uniref:Extracellular metalloproteinase n=1 Tax=Batrachochytrium salamandrivorans TaxID=1357716 RepID=A0ABQ8ET26_9FUNG|nr:hypothetical protein BASA62_009487 [Batrachochytrium salamandrivorans]KAH6577704.1 hypothetical protein BASA60_003901 [Batrachochytrium salamandrivorans]KAH6585669.1 hypothetical protein BASA50_001003 [Batrachochytrium salamandrivorans]KAH6592577.1 hypothetical protein BASA61_004513 [Batrachochytrium salamandrivorans]KAH9248994.1 hypothetical protein BASA81_013339 [Batrachochytrium salamandrivorans]
MFGPALTLVLALVSSAVVAVPATSLTSHKKAIASLNSESTDVPFYFPSSVYEHLPRTEGSSFTHTSEEDSVKIGIDYIISKLDLAPSDFQTNNVFTDAAGTTHIYGCQVINGARIANHQASIHVNAGVVTSYSTSFGTAQHFTKNSFAAPSTKAAMTFEKVSAGASAKLGVPVYSKFSHILEYVEQPDGALVYAYKFQLRDSPLTKWVQVWSNANTGQVIQVVDFSNKISFRAIPLPRHSPDDGFDLIQNPEFKASSPNGWVDDNTTKGNNAVAVSPFNSIGASANRKGVFDAKFDENEDPRTATNEQVSSINLFYLTNVMHDITYQYGFTEKTGNFQNNNFGKGGKGNDAIVINVLSNRGTNNANFFTPSDGQPGEMNMFRFTSTRPNRDGGLDNPIPIHEFGHGLSNRLTGGSATSQCLRTNEARGMGEGWSDVLALFVTSKPTDKPTTKIVFGSYVLNNQRGIRSRPYTTDMKVNPLTFSDLQTRGEVHDIGEVWAAMVWEVYWNLVNKHGFSANLHDAKQTKGNIIAMQNVIGGLMRQPCNPTFLSARDAIIEADKSFYGGANKCEIIKGFAKRGLGLNANNFRNDFSVPKECSGASPNPAPVPVPVPVPQTPPTKGGPKKTVTKRGPKKTVTKDEPKKTVKRGPKKTVTKRGPKKTATKRGPKKTIKRRPKKTATKRGPKPTKLPRTPGNLKCDPNNICCFYLGFDC